jgi:hypothetical protein
MDGLYHRISRDLNYRMLGRCGLIQLGLDRAQWRALVVTIMNLRVP